MRRWGRGDGVEGKGKGGRERERGSINPRYLYIFILFQLAECNSQGHQNGVRHPPSLLPHHRHLPPYPVLLSQQRTRPFLKTTQREQLRSRPNSFVGSRPNSFVGSRPDSFTSSGSRPTSVREASPSLDQVGTS